MKNPTYQHGFYAPGRGYKARYPQLWKGCVGAWSMGLGPTGTKLFDWSGFRNDGTLTNMDANSDWVQSVDGYALDFDGSNDFIPLTNDIDLPDGFTISAWINKSATGGRCIIAATTPVDSEWYLRIAETCGFRDTLQNYNEITVADVTLNVWHHVCLRYNRQQLTYWLNAVDTTRASYTTQVKDANTVPSIGRIGVVSANYWSGKLDDIRIYNRSLSANEIALLASRRNIAYERMSPSRMAYSEQVAAGGVANPVLFHAHYMAQGMRP